MGPSLKIPWSLCCGKTNDLIFLFVVAYISWHHVKEHVHCPELSIYVWYRVLWCVVLPDKRQFIFCFYQTWVKSLSTLVTNSLSKWCFVDLTDVTLAVEDAILKLAEVVAFAGVDIEESVDKRFVDSWQQLAMFSKCLILAVQHFNNKGMSPKKIEFF